MRNVLANYISNSGNIRISFSTQLYIFEIVDFFFFERYTRQFYSILSVLKVLFQRFLNYFVSFFTDHTFKDQSEKAFSTKFGKLGRKEEKSRVSTRQGQKETSVVQHPRFQKTRKNATFLALLGEKTEIPRCAIFKWIVWIVT